MTLEGAPGKSIRWQGRELLNAASNNYLDLAQHPALAEAAAVAARQDGVGAGGARLLGGTTPWHVALEEKLRSYRPLGNTLLFNTGFMANLGLMQALGSLLGPIFSDHANHASVMDGLVFSNAGLSKPLKGRKESAQGFHRYRHADMNHLEALLRSHGGENSLVVSETLFSMDGDLAPLDDLFALQDRHGFWLYLDEAHSTLCMPGMLESRLQGRERLIIMGTFGKAFGGFGAYVAAPAEVIAYIVNACRTFLFSTALPPPVLAAAAVAMDVAAAEPERAETLSLRAKTLREGLIQEGFHLGSSQSHIIPVLVGSSEAALAWSASLRNQGVHAPAIRPPTVPTGASRLRLSLTSAFTVADLQKLIAALIVARANQGGDRR